MQVAQTILQQLGGNKFAAMTGAKNFSGTPNALMFKLPANFAKNGINHVTVTLTPADLYTMTFSKVRGLKVVEIEVSEDCYCDMLQSEFKRVTGLDTKLF